MPFTTLPSSQRLHYSDLLTTLSSPPTVFSPSSPPPSKTVLFLHGLGSSQNFYLPLLPYLPPNYRCILLDTPGAARSPLPSNATSISIQDIAKTAWELLDHMCVEGEVSVVGHSMGCLVASWVAQMRVERVKEVVLLGPVYPSQQLEEVFGARIKTVQEQGMESMANTIPNAATGPSTTPLVKAMIRELLLNQTVEGYSALCGAIASATVGEPEAVKKGGVRVLVVAGSEDKSAPMEGCRKHSEELGGRVEIVEGLGHWHVVECPERVGEMVRGFFMKK